MSDQWIYKIRPSRENIRISIAFSILIMTVLIAVGTVSQNQIHLEIFLRLILIMPITSCCAYWYYSSSICVGKTQYMYKSFKNRHCVKYRNIERVVILEIVENNKVSYDLMIKAKNVHTVPNIEIFNREEMAQFIECLAGCEGQKYICSAAKASILESLNMIKWVSK